VKEKEERRIINTFWRKELVKDGKIGDKDQWKKRMVQD
jgi:hypothetical protein